MLELSELPLETKINILEYLDAVTLAKCRCLNKAWKELIDENDRFWYLTCRRDFPCSSKIAKKKAAPTLKWYNIYKNLYKWTTITSYELQVRTFNELNSNDYWLTLEIDSSILPLKASRGIELYDLSTMRHLPVAIPKKKCHKIAHNDTSTVVLLQHGLMIQRKVENGLDMSQAFFLADNCVLAATSVYFYRERDVYKCDLTKPNLTPTLLFHCDYDLKEIEFNNGNVIVFTLTDKIVVYSSNNMLCELTITIPVEWMQQIRHIKAIDQHNFVCFSLNIFMIQTDKYQHLYLDFPLITALFFYGDDTVLIGTPKGEILLYKLSCQKKATSPIFEKLASLPKGHFAVSIDVTERTTGPAIVIATCFEMMIIEIDFFPDAKPQKVTFSPDREAIYERLLKISDRLLMY